MKFLQLDIKNFLTIGVAAPVKLDGKGLVLIQGINQDDTSAISNGAGKSSIPDALCWALYGVTARDETGDAVVNNTAKKDCSVSVLLQDGDTVYRITRYRKDKNYKNQTIVEAATDDEEISASSVWVNLSKGTEKETQEVINGIMGCSIDVFRAAIYAGQEEMPDLPKMTDKQLKLLIEEAAGVERLEGAYLKAREKWSGAKSQLDKHTSDLTMFNNRVAALTAQRVGYTAAHLEYEQTRKGRHEGYLGNATNIRADMLKTAGIIKSLDEAAITTEIAELDAALAKNAVLVAGERELVGAVTRASQVLTRAQGVADASADTAKRIKAVIDNAAEEMKKPCPECGKPHTEDELAEYVAVQKGKLVSQVERAKLDQGAVAAATRTHAEAEESLVKYRAKMPDVSDVSARQRELTVKLSAIKGHKSDLQLLKKDFDRNNELAAQALVEKNPHEASVELLNSQIAALEIQVAEVQKTIAVDQDNVSLYENVTKVFGPAGVRAHILDSVTPMLNERTSDYLSALSDGNVTAVWSTLSTTAKGELKEKFNIDVENDKGAKTFKGLSGGEKRKVRLATMLALQDLVASRASKPIELWIGDEIDDAMDGAGLERLMGVLEGKARERGTVLVISHNELRDWIDNVVTVTKSGGLSVIEGALC